MKVGDLIQYKAKNGCFMGGKMGSVLHGWVAKSGITKAIPDTGYNLSAPRKA